MPINQDTHYVIKNGIVEQPAVVKDGLELYYDAKGKHNTDVHKDTLLDLSGNNRHGTLSNFAYEGVSGYQENGTGGILLDDVDDKIVRPAIPNIEYASASRNVFESIQSEWESGTFSTYLTMNEPNATRIRQVSMNYALDLNTTYTVSVASGYVVNLNVNSTNRTYAQSITFTPTSNNGLVRFVIKRADETNITTAELATAKFQLEKASVATTYTPYVPMPVFTYQMNGNILSYENQGIVKRVHNGNIVSSNVNFFGNSNLRVINAQGVTTKHPNTYLSGWGQYNGGISNPTTSYHAHIDIDTFGYNVVEYNESDGSRNWKACGKSGLELITKETGVYTISFDLNATGSGTRVYGGFYSCLKEGTVYNFHSGQFSVSPTDTNNWSRYSANCTLHESTDFTKGISFYIYGFDFSTNSILYMKDIKLEKGSVSTEYNIYPHDLLNTLEIKNNLVGDMENLQGNDFEQHEDGVITYTNEAEEGSVVRVDIDGVSFQDVGSGKNIFYKNELYSKDSDINDDCLNISIGDRFFYQIDGVPNAQYTTSFDYKRDNATAPVSMSFYYTDGTSDENPQLMSSSDRVRLTLSSAIGKTVSGVGYNPPVVLGCSWKKISNPTMERTGLALSLAQEDESLGVRWNKLQNPIMERV